MQMNQFRRRWLVTLVLLIIVTCYAPTHGWISAQEQSTKECSQIVFVGLSPNVASDLPLKSAIFVMDAEGSQLRQLTETEASDSNPSWSPDGKYILFASDRDSNGETGLGRYDLYIMNSDGTNIQRLTQSAKGIDAYQPVWSPDGKWILYVAEAVAQVREIQIISADGEQQPSLNIRGLLPNWSPDGKQIVYTGIVEDEPWNSEIYVMDVDGSNVKRLTNSEGGDTQASWSPDGEWIVFVSKRDQHDKSDGPADIYLMRKDGTDVKRLTSSWGSAPSWSPDGKQIIYAGSGGITVMNDDGTQPKVILSGSYFKPTWSPWLCSQPTE